MRSFHEKRVVHFQSSKHIFEMASVGLTILYCLNMTLSNGGFKSFELQPSTSYNKIGLYYTPELCDTENDFWLRQAEQFTLNVFHERWKSFVDFIHHEHLGKSGNKTRNEWTAQCFGRTTKASVTINGNSLAQFKTMGLIEGDTIEIKYAGMTKPLKFEYGKCPSKNESAVGVTIKTRTSTLNRTKTKTPTFKRIEAMTYEKMVELEELVKVLFSQMSTLNMKVAHLRVGQSILRARSYTWLVVFTIISVFAISVVLALIIHKSRLQNKQIATLSIEVTRYRTEIL